MAIVRNKDGRVTVSIGLDLLVEGDKDDAV